jgi:putative protease
MNTIGLIPELVKAGIDSFKIEGHMKSAYYTAVVTNAYRMALDRYFEDPDSYEFDEALERELNSVSHREYATGYYENTPYDATQLCTMDGYIREKAYFAIAEGESRDGVACFKQKNKIKVGDMAELLSPGKVGRPFRVEQLYDAEGNPIEAAPHPSELFYCRVPFEVHKGDILRSGEEN